MAQAQSRTKVFIPKLTHNTFTHSIDNTHSRFDLRLITTKPQAIMKFLSVLALAASVSAAAIEVRQDWNTWGGSQCSTETVYHTTTVYQTQTETQTQTKTQTEYQTKTTTVVVTPAPVTVVSVCCVEENKF